jgi:HMG (high mobility group) box
LCDVCINLKGLTTCSNGAVVVAPPPQPQPLRSGKRAASTTKAAHPPPKRGKNAYLVYLAKHEPTVHAQHPEMTRNQVMNIVAATWKEVSAEERVRRLRDGQSQHCDSSVALKLP